MLTRRICFFWAQGEAAAPDLVKRCWQAWADKNPDWQIEIADSADAAQAFAKLGIAHPPNTMQGQADIYRMYTLAEAGGIYCDAATIPMAPLSEWIAPLAEQGFFAFHDPYRRRPVENWFLVSAPGNPIMRAWVEATVAYWQKPRRQQLSRRELDPGLKGALSEWLTSARVKVSGRLPRVKRVLEPKRRAWSVAPDGGGARPVHPYFWPHYLFDHMLHTRPEIRAAWSETPKLGSYKDLMLRHWKRDYASLTAADLRSLTAGSRMQKLALNAAPPTWALDLLLPPQPATSKS